MVIDLPTLVELVGTTVLFVAPVILIRWLAGPDGPSLSDLFATSPDPTWPRGVQEEEPIAWRLERLHPRVVAPHVRGDRASRSPRGCPEGWPRVHG